MKARAADTWPDTPRNRAEIAERWAKGHDTLKPSYFGQAVRNLAARPEREIDPTRTVGFLPLIEAAE